MGVALRDRRALAAVKRQSGEDVAYRSWRDAAEPPAPASYMHNQRPAPPAMQSPL